MTSVYQLAGLSGNPLTAKVLYRVLKEVNSDAEITKEASEYVLSLLTDLKTRYEATSGNDKERVQAILPGELAKYVYSEMTRALARYANAIEDSSEENLKKQSPKIKVAAMLEYISAEILELSGNDARDRNRTRIQLQDIHTAIDADKELKQVFSEFLPSETLFMGTLPEHGGVEAKKRGALVTKTQVTADLKTALGKQKANKDVIEVSVRAIRYLQTLFGQVADENLQAWLDSLPNPDPHTVNLNQRLYRQVLGLIVAGLKHYSPTEPLGYAQVVKAIDQNPYYQLSPYLRTTELAL